MELGHGIESQELRCKEYIQRKNLVLDKIFRDEGISGKIAERPAIRELLTYLATHPKTVVVIDDQKRLARDVQVYLLLKQTIQRFDCTIEYLNHNFEDSPEGNFIETILAASGQLEREQNTRQTIQKMTSRMKDGYWTLHQPFGYQFLKVEGNKLMKAKPESKKALQEALEGYAHGRFNSVIEVTNFMLENGLKTSKSRTKSILSNSLYAGYYSRPDWGVPFMKGRHEAIISLDTHNKIIQRLENETRGVTKTTETFPLRGCVKCAECGSLFTASTPKGRTEHYSYYFCQKKGCSQRYKNIPKEKLESEFLELLEKIQPNQVIIDQFIKIFEQAWLELDTEYNSQIRKYKMELGDLKASVQFYLERLPKTKDLATIETYEATIGELRKKEVTLKERLDTFTKQDLEYSQTDYGTALNSVIEFSKNLVNIWKNSGSEGKKTTFKMVFAEHLVYSQNGIYGTAVLTDLYTYFEGISRGLFTFGRGSGNIMELVKVVILSSDMLKALHYSLVN